ncbi:MAG: DUF503 domain-containing protein [Nitrospirae bacterium]|nr:DUF503 domain-containing protein [Nitrospirota bacterium]MBF0542040.1 DUF503 domain-containing protein [Nitrospirota bacterium]
MVIGLLTVDLHIPDSNSLKSKRFIIKSLKDRLRNTFNISISEEPNNLWQAAQIYIVSVTTDNSHLDSIFEKIKNMIDKEPLIVVIDYNREIL